jgi:DNA repair protein RecO (recombination protein O)
MITTNALVLRRSDWRDYDRMVTLLSPTMGRLEAVVRGCKRPKSPLINAAEPFCAGEFSLVEARGRYTVTGCQVQECYFPLRQDYDKLIHGAYYLHLLSLSTLPGEACQDMFLLALRALAFLSYAQLPPELITAAFELHYMAHMGQAPRMEACVVCGCDVAGPAGFSDRLGGAVCARCADGRAFPLSEGARRILLKVPAVRFDVIDKLLGHPDWPEAAAHARRFILERMEQLPKTLPPLMTGENP